MKFRLQYSKNFVRKVFGLDGDSSNRPLDGDGCCGEAWPELEAREILEPIQRLPHLLVVQKNLHCRMFTKYVDFLV
jgi:hypothetical protein